VGNKLHIGKGCERKHISEVVHLQTFEYVLENVGAPEIPLFTLTNITGRVNAYKEIARCFRLGKHFHSREA